MVEFYVLIYMIHKILEVVIQTSTVGWWKNFVQKIDKRKT